MTARRASERTRRRASGRTGRRLPKKTQEARGRRLTSKQRALVKGVAAGKSVHRAALEAGYSPAVARSDVYQNPRLRVAITKLMDEMGLDEAALLKALKDALRAHRRGKIPDHPIRLRAAETGLKLRGHLGKEDGAPVQGPSGITFRFEGGAPREMQTLVLVRSEEA